MPPHAQDLDPEELAPSTGTPRASGRLARRSSSKVEKAALAKLLSVRSDDLWGVADSVAQAIEPSWDAKRGVYHTGSAVRSRANAEMLLVHSQALAAHHKGQTNRPARIAPLITMLTGQAWVPGAHTGASPNCPRGGAECWHAMGFIDPGSHRATMHRSRDAVVMRALAAAWRVRKAAGLSPSLISRLRRVVSLTARSPFWQMPKRLENQVNWTADVMDAYTTVTASNTLIRREYPAQLHWFLSHARATAYPGGTDNLSVGMGFHYVPSRPDSYEINGEDTVEYANITFGALKYFDTARRHGAPALSAPDRRMLARWTAHLLDGCWTTAGYPNWDTGHGVGRLHLNQYWLLSLRGLAMGLAGTANERLFPHQVTVARGLVRRAVELYQRRARDAGTPILGPSSYGFYGSELIGEHWDGLTSAARVTELMSEFAGAGLGAGVTTRLPSAFSHDTQFGRLAVSTGRYSTAFLGAWRGMRSGGAEPSRIMDTKARVLTQIGGGYDGTLGLAVYLKGRLLVDTQPGSSGKGVSLVHVGSHHNNRSGPLGRGMTVSAAASGSGVTVHVAHRVTERGITTSYTITNRHSQPVDGVLRVPTYDGAGGSSLHKHPPAVHDLRNLTITTATGGSFKLAFRGLPHGAATRVVTAKGQQSNPRAGAELLVRVRLAHGGTTITRGIAPTPSPVGTR